MRLSSQGSHVGQSASVSEVERGLVAAEWAPETAAVVGLGLALAVAFPLNALNTSEVPAVVH
jgi:hypothetical protein